MKAFEYVAASSVEEAISVLSRHDGNARPIAGGSDLLGMVKDKIQGPALAIPKVVVDLRTIPGLDAIKEDGGGLRIGALVTLSALESSEVIKSKFPGLVQAGWEVAAPQIRNVGTVGGNLAQRPRCWYFRDGLFGDCYKRGGDFCYAVTGENQYHSILEGELCYFVHPSDLAPMLIALDSTLTTAGPNGERTVPVEKFFTGPREDVLRENILQPNEIITEIQVPGTWAGTRQTFLKLKLRESFDFAVVSVAVALKGPARGAIEDARIVLGGVAPTPYRATRVEDLLKGKVLDETVAQQAGQAAVLNARPMSLNAYKVDLTETMVKRALMSIA
ncbi:MAG TPA: molybdopterin dehydrogenase [Chloroflexi bacterium]|nr:molybdopterin dehydrogenase [Chloroflexota bacterium]